MIRCLLFGHVPNELFEIARRGVHRTTCCERCGVSVTHLVPPERPLPDGAMTEDDRARRYALIVAERVSDEIETLVRLRNAEIGRLLAKHTAKVTAKNTNAAKRRAAKVSKS